MHSLSFGGIEIKPQHSLLIGLRVYHTQEKDRQGTLAIFDTVKT